MHVRCARIAYLPSNERQMSDRSYLPKHWTKIERAVADFATISGSSVLPNCSKIHFDHEVHAPSCDTELSLARTLREHPELSGRLCICTKEVQ